MAQERTASGPPPLGDLPGVVARPELFELLAGAQRVAVVTAPAGSGKTWLVRSWIADAGLAARVGWVSVGRPGSDPQGFWLSVLDSLRATAPGATLISELTAAPDLDGWRTVERLLRDLTPLRDRLWLVIDDLQELEAAQASDQLERFLALAPAPLRVVLLTRRDLRLGLHRLRLQGDLTEIRREDLRFTLEESSTLLETAGTHLSDSALEGLVARTEGWVAGLRLAALSLARSPDPEQFAADFTGSERTVTDYLLAEVLDRQPDDARRLLLRTSLLERVSGQLADALTGEANGQRILQELEGAGAFVLAIDPQRTWFRYHRMFADLLALELRRTAPEEVDKLHATAAQWFAEHGYPLEAIRHAQRAQDWSLAVRLLSDHWFGLYLDGRGAVAHELLGGFPDRLVAMEAELAAVAAADEIAIGSLEEAERHVANAARCAARVPDDRRGRLEAVLGTLRLALAQRNNDPQAAHEQAQLLLASEAPDAIRLGRDDDMRAMALTDLGIAELWTGRLDEAEQDLEEGVKSARRIHRPLIEIVALGFSALLSLSRSLQLAEERSRQAIELADANGWADQPRVGAAYMALVGITSMRGRLEEAEAWLARAEHVLDVETEPVQAIDLYGSRGLLELARGRHVEAQIAFRTALQLGGHLVMPHWLTSRLQAQLLLAMVRAGETEQAERALDEVNEDVRGAPEMRVALAALRLAQNRPDTAVAVLGPLLDSRMPMAHRHWDIQALLVEATAREALADPTGVSMALERALDLAEPDGLVLAFFLFPAPELLDRHRRSDTAHASLTSEILAMLSGTAPTSGHGDVEPLIEPLTDTEIRVLRYLPTNLRAPEIAAELFVSINTVRTHLRHLYAKLGVNGRTDAVERARQLGLLSPSRGGR